MADKRKNKRMMDNYKFKPETTDQVPTEPDQETIVKSTLRRHCHMKRLKRRQ